jgi:DNA-binding MarR family transcriptional regulator
VTLPLKESEAKVLLALLRNKSTPIMTLPRIAKLGGSAVYNSVRWLSERGLVEESRETEAPRRRMIILTGKGKQVAELLARVEEEL